MADEKRCVVDGDPEAEAEEKEASRGAEMYQVEREEKKILKRLGHGEPFSRSEMYIQKST